MPCLNSLVTRMFVAGTLILVLGAGSAWAELAYPVVTDMNTSAGLAWGQTDLYSNTGMMEWDEDRVYQGNDILVTTLVGVSDSNGLGISFPISNGENGIDETDCQGAGGACDGTGNVDVPNTEPVNTAIANVNAAGTGKLTNGNIIRASVWMRSDPDSPAVGAPVTPPQSDTNMPQVEALLKVELWKEGLGTEGDFDGPGDSDYGDRIWDQDQQGGEGSWADINADGWSAPTAWGKPVAATLNTSTWTQVVVEFEINDAIASSPVPHNANAGFPWDIGLDSFTVADVEDVRVSFFAGDWSGTDFTGGGSWWMDNLAVEVFLDQAAADAVDPTSTNPAPVETASEPGDYDGDGFVGQSDLDLVLLNWGDTSPPAPAGWLNEQPDGLIGQTALDGVLLNWGNGSAPTIAAVPEPASVALLFVAALCLGGATRRGR